MTVWLCKELHTSRLAELLQKVKNLPCMLFEQFEGHAADTECHLEILAVLVCHVEHGTKCRDITLGGCLYGGTLVLVVVVVVMVLAYVKETISLEMNGLMYLKV